MYPMTSSTIAQMVMKVQQDLAGFAIKGDGAGDGLPAQDEKPDWATFDEDEPEADKPSANGARQTEGRFALYSVTDVPGAADPGGKAGATSGARRGNAEGPSGPCRSPADRR